MYQASKDGELTHDETTITSESLIPLLKGQIKRRATPLVHMQKK